MVSDKVVDDITRIIIRSKWEKWMVMGKSLLANFVFWIVGTFLLWIALKITGFYGWPLLVATALTAPFMFLFKFYVNKNLVFDKKVP